MNQELHKGDKINVDGVDIYGLPIKGIVEVIHVEVISTHRIVIFVHTGESSTAIRLTECQIWR